MKYAGQRKTFEEDWGIHSDSSEWWYATGYAKNDMGRLFSYQFTLVRANIKQIPGNPYIAMLALTDFENEKHYYYQDAAMIPMGIKISDKIVKYKDKVTITKEAQNINFKADTDEFHIDLNLDNGKGAFWHCDDGILRMGVDEPGQTTFYYSYTNMPTSGQITVNGEQFTVTGKSWFDKQGGTYDITDPKCQWEWFSLRFYDDEEMMLFTFPEDDYQDGTYIKKDCTTQRLQNYTVEATRFIKPNGTTTYSTEWKLTIPGEKEENYLIKPLMEGTMMNLGYFELLAGIYNDKNEQVGMCFVELLPGARNDEMPPADLLFKKTGK